VSIRIEITDKGIVEANGFAITNLRKPFSHIKDRKISKIPSAKVVRKPSYTIKSKKMKYYHCPLDEQHYACLPRLTPKEFKCHGIYHTQKHISKLLRVKALHQLFMNTSNDEYNQAMFFIERVLKCIIKSFDFDMIISDFDLICDIGITTMQPNWVVRYVSNYDLDVIRGLLATYKSLPISACDSILSNIDPETETTINPDVVKDYKRIIVLSATNAFYSSYITDYLYQIYPDKEILPVSLFVFNNLHYIGD